MSAVQQAGEGAEAVSMTDLPLDDYSPRILIGDPGNGRKRLELQSLGWGRMVVEKPPNPYPGEWWGLDNGAFGAWKHGTQWQAELFLRRVDMALKVERPSLIVVPDIVAGGERSLEFSLAWVERLPDELPLYLAVQDGMTLENVEAVIGTFDGVFLGGTDAFKLTAAAWAKLAHYAGKPFHYGRCGTLAKVDHALRVGADSLDSSFPLWTRRRWAAFVRHINERPQGVLWP